MAWTKVARVDEVPAESVIEVMVGPEPYAICNSGGEIRALSGVCIHQGGPLGQGQIHEGHVVCPFHMWEFDCRTGEYDYNPAMRVPTYPVKVENGEIFIEVR
jgi:nitrite reductase (NADH) small subunit